MSVVITLNVIYLLSKFGYILKKTYNFLYAFLQKILDMTRRCMEPDNLLCKADKDGNIPLHIAASKGNIKLMKMLLDSDPLYLQIKKEFEASKKRYTKYEIHEEVQKRLEKDPYGEFHNQLMKKNDAGKTPLHVAAENGQME